MPKLIRALKSVEKIDCPIEQYEVIVVDDGSTDQTATYIRELKQRTKINLIYISQNNQGPAAARNNGIKQAQGDYIFIVDSDCIVDSNVLKHYLRHFPDDKLGGVGGNVLPDNKSLVSEFLDYTSVWRPGYVNGEISYLITANAFFLRRAIQEAGYFDEDFNRPGGEEPELCYRIRKQGYHFRYDNNAAVIHSHRTSISDMVKMFFIHGKGNCVFVKKHPDVCDWMLSLSSLLRIILGDVAMRDFLHNYVQNLDFSKAISFFVLKYLQQVAFYSGFFLKLREIDRL